MQQSACPWIAGRRIQIGEAATGAGSDCWEHARADAASAFDVHRARAGM